MGAWDWITGNTAAGVTSSTAKAMIDSTLGGIGDLIKIWKLPPEAELAFKQFMADEQYKLMQLSAASTDSARNLEQVTRSRMPAILTLVYQAAFIGISGWLLYYAFEMPNIVMNNFQSGLVGMIYMHITKEAMLGSTFYLGGTLQDTAPDPGLASLTKETPPTKP